MQTCTIRDMDYQGPTRNPNGDALERLTRQYAPIRSLSAFKRMTAMWGLTSTKQNRPAFRGHRG